MTICYFGNYDPDYSRNKVLIRGLEKNGVTILRCNDRSPGLKKYLNLIKAHRQVSGKYDALVVGYSVQGSRFLVLLARLLTRKPIIWDALFSLYDNWIFDRKLASPRSVKAGYYWVLDWFCCIVSNLIILDTNANIEYFIKTFHIPRVKFLRVLVGVDDEIMVPLKNKEEHDDFIVEFHGRYIPVQGTTTIIKAAKILENEKIIFQMIGAGQELSNTKKLAQEIETKNVVFFPAVSYNELPNYIAGADVCLGLLGSVPRVVRAIPNKVYEAAAMRKAIINADTAAIKELFSNQQSILLCRAGDPGDLADKIRELKNNSLLREEIADKAYLQIQQKATPTIIGRDFKLELEKIINKK